MIMHDSQMLVYPNVRFSLPLPVFSVQCSVLLLKTMLLSDTIFAQMYKTISYF